MNRLHKCWSLIKHLHPHQQSVDTLWAFMNIDGCLSSWLTIITVIWKNRLPHLIRVFITCSRCIGSSGAVIRLQHSCLWDGAPRLQPACPRCELTVPVQRKCSPAGVHRAGRGSVRWSRPTVMTGDALSMNISHVRFCTTANKFKLNDSLCPNF